jgi:formylmethanofuran dehydrogenase subunit E
MYIGPYSFEVYCEKAAAFHGTAAPGVLIGGWLVNLAQQYLPEDILYDVICESRKCLPDAIQLLTPCTIGNGWLKIIDVGRFAAAFYNKFTGEGVRVALDVNKLESWTEIKRWFLKTTPKQAQNRTLLREQIKTAHTTIFSIEPVTIHLALLDTHKHDKIMICPICHEASPDWGGMFCKECQDSILPYIHPITTLSSFSRQLNYQYLSQNDLLSVENGETQG